MPRWPHVLLLPLLLLIPFSVSANWIDGGIPIANLPGQQNRPALLSDGLGGVFVIWFENGTLQRDIFAQRVDQDGNRLWAEGGVPVCACTGSQVLPKVVSDGSGGAFVAWENNPNGAAGGDVIYLGRIDAAGQVLFNDRAVGGGWLNEWSMIPDGNHGVVVTWSVGGPQYAQVLAQRFDSDGVPQWSSAVLCNLTYDLDQNRDYPVVAPAFPGGFRIYWSDFRRSYWDYDVRPHQFYGAVDLYTQLVDGSGQQVPSGNGQLLQQDGHAGPLALGATGGAAMALEGGVSLNRKLQVQRLDTDGTQLWLSDVVTGVNTYDWLYPWIEPDGVGGFVVAWQASIGNDLDPYAQRLGPDGSKLWPSPVSFFPGAGNYSNSAVIADGLGGLVAVVQPWACCGVARLQRVDGLGALPWGTTGVALSNASYFYDSALALDGAGGVYCAWADDRDGESYSVFLQRFNLNDGSWGNPVAVAISSFEAVAENGRVTLSATFRSDLDVTNISVYRAVNDGSLKVLETVTPMNPSRFEYTDTKVTPGESYRYQIGITDADGEFVSQIRTVTVPRLEAVLEQNQPNPFNPATTIRFTLPSRGAATLAIYDAEGRLVKTLMDEVVPAGVTTVEWDGRNDSGNTVTSGVYFYRLTSGKFGASRKMLLLK